MVERRPEEPGVGGSSPPLGTMDNSVQVNQLFFQSFRFESPASAGNAIVAQLVEHNLPKVGVAGSNPVYRSTYN